MQNTCKTYFIVLSFSCISFQHLKSSAEEHSAFSPSETYKIYINAIDSEDIDSLVHYSKTTEQLSKDQYYKYLPEIRKLLPENISIKKEIIIDRMALLYTRGYYSNEDLKTQYKCNGITKLARINNQWKIEKNYWKCPKVLRKL